jgi:Flp pilus assembly protein CpaB
MADSGDALPLWRRRVPVRRSVRRMLLSRRRPLAAIFAAVAVLGVVHAVQPASPSTVAVTVAAHDLASGTVLGSDDLTVRRFPTGDVPGGASVGGVGRTLAAPMRAGEPLTDVRLVSPTLVAAYPDRVAMPVRIADADAVGLLRVGDHVDLLAADPHGGRASYVALNVPVLALPKPSAPSGGSGATLPGRLVVVAAAPSEVTSIVGAAATDLLSVVLRG